MREIDSVIIVDYNEMDNFINYTLLEYNGVKDIRLFKKQNEALDFLIQTEIKFQFVIVGSTPHTICGFDFIDRFNKLGLDAKHSKIILLSAFFSPEEIEIANKKQTLVLEKPLKINDLLIKIK